MISKNEANCKTEGPQKCGVKSKEGSQEVRSKIMSRSPGTQGLKRDGKPHT